MCINESVYVRVKGRARARVCVHACGCICIDTYMHECIFKVNSLYMNVLVSMNFYIFAC